MKNYPAISFQFEGQQREQSKMGKSMGKVMPIMMLCMFSAIACGFGSFYQAKISNSSDGSKWVIPSMTTVNASVYYKLKLMDRNARVKLGIKNVGDKRAPLADGYNGFFSDVHSDLGRNYYLDFRVDL